MQTVKEVMKGDIRKTTRSYKCNWTQQNWKSNAKTSGHCWATYLFTQLQNSYAIHTIHFHKNSGEREATPAHLLMTPWGKGHSGRLPRNYPVV